MIRVSLWWWRVNCEVARTNNLLVTRVISNQAGLKHQGSKAIKINTDEHPIQPQNNNCTDTTKSSQTAHLSKSRYLEALTHSSRNHGVAGAEKSRRDEAEVDSDVRATAAALVLPKSINGVGASR